LQLRELLHILLGNKRYGGSARRDMNGRLQLTIEASKGSGCPYCAKGDPQRIVDEYV